VDDRDDYERPSDTYQFIWPTRAGRADRERRLNPRRRAVDGPNGTRISAKSRAATRSRFGASLRKQRNSVLGFGTPEMVP
jgi:hypothetical protein